MIGHQGTFWSHFCPTKTFSQLPLTESVHYVVHNFGQQVAPPLFSFTLRPNHSFLLFPGAALSPSAFHTGICRLHYVSYPASGENAAPSRRSLWSLTLCGELKGFVCVFPAVYRVLNRG